MQITYLEAVGCDGMNRNVMVLICRQPKGSGFDDHLTIQLM